MYTRTFIRGRILFRASTHVRPATPQPRRADGNRRVLSSGYSGSSRLQSRPNFGWPASAERLVPAPGEDVRLEADTPLTGVAAATSALTSFTTRLFDPKITG